MLSLAGVAPFSSQACQDLGYKIGRSAVARQPRHTVSAAWLRCFDRE